MEERELNGRCKQRKRREGKKGEREGEQEVRGRRG